MKRRLFVALALGAAILGGLSWAALHPGPALAQDGGDLGGSTYLTDIITTSGTPASRSVISFHHDGTMSVVDSSQGAGSFGSQLGAWKHSTGNKFIARTINFNYSPEAGIIRADYDITLVGGTPKGGITLTSFTLDGNPLVDRGGTLIGTFRFTSQRVIAK
jgi:hypothetical protein